MRRDRNHELALSGIRSQVTVKSQDPVFWWIVSWLSQSDYGATARRLRLETSVAHAQHHSMPQSSGHDELRIVLSPADGVHWFFHRSSLVVVQRGKEGGGPAAGTTFPREEITVSAFGFGTRRYLTDLIDEARRCVAPDEDTTSIYSNASWDWSAAVKVPRRPLESVVLRAGVAQRLAKDADTFLKSKQWYRDRAIPWRRGYLLYGQPGCGKTSIAHALASHLGMNVAVLSLSGAAGDAALRNLMQTMPPRCLLLIEDIDAAFNQRDGKDAEAVTFSGLLNAIDGIAAAEGRILVMTTNHIGTIDPALRRPGRADIELEIEPADEEQAALMFLRFFPERAHDATDFGRQNAGRSPAFIQGELLALRGCGEAP